MCELLDAGEQESKSGLSSSNRVVTIFDNDEKQGDISMSSVTESNMCVSLVEHHS